MSHTRVLGCEYHSCSQNRALAVHFATGMNNNCYCWESFIGQLHPWMCGDLNLWSALLQNGRQGTSLYNQYRIVQQGNKCIYQYGASSGKSHQSLTGTFSVLSLDSTYSFVFLTCLRGAHSTDQLNTHFSKRNDTREKWETLRCGQSKKKEKHCR